MQPANGVKWYVYLALKCDNAKRETMHGERKEKSALTRASFVSKTPTVERTLLYIDMYMLVA